MWREYRLARMFGWTLEEIADVPGEWIDWALKFDDMGGGDG